jgi:hypothetical protein
VAESGSASSEVAGAQPPVPYRKCFLAALPDLFLGVLFVLAASRVFTPLMQPSSFATVMQVELFAIHSTIFLGAAALTRAHTAHEQLGRMVIFWAIVAFYLLLAFSAGFRVGVGFILVTLGTNVGLLLTWRSLTASVQLVVRWLVTFLLLIVCANLAGMPRDIGQWDASDPTFRFGAVYFLAAGAVEASGFFLRTVPSWWTARVTPHVVSGAGQLPGDIQKLFAATGRVVHPWVEKLKGLL